MIASTTSSSIRVKPAWHVFFTAALPLPVGDAVEPDPRRGRIDVIDVIALLRVVRLARIAAPAPGFGIGEIGLRVERIAWNPPQEIDLGPLGIAPIGHAFDQDVEILRIVGAAGFLLDPAILARLVIEVDAGANLAQGATQLRLLAALARDLGNRRRDRREQPDDGERHQKLDERETSFRPSSGHRALICTLNGAGGVAVIGTPPTPVGATDRTWMLVDEAGASALNVTVANTFSAVAPVADAVWSEMINWPLPESRLEKLVPPPLCFRNGPSAILVTSSLVGSKPSVTGSALTGSDAWASRLTVTVPPTAACWVPCHCSCATPLAATPPAA